MFQFHVSIYVLLIGIAIKGISLFHNYKFVSRISFTSVLRRIIIAYIGLLLVIPTSNINILVFYTSMYL